MVSFSFQELLDLERALDIARGNINVFSDTFSRFGQLEKKVREELNRRREE